MDVFATGLSPDPRELVLHADPRAPEIHGNAAGHRRWAPLLAGPGAVGNPWGKYGAIHGKGWENLD